jgi:hypothetical protein
MELQFARREIKSPGEILHVCALRLWLSQLGVLSQTRAEVLAEGKQYIDDLYAAGEVATPAFQNSGVERRFGFGGYAYYEEEEPDFKVLFDYMSNKIQQAKEDNYRPQAQALLTDMTVDPNKYVEQVAYTNKGNNAYVYVPLLATLEPDVFVNTVLQQSPASQRTIMAAFKARYDAGGLTNQLAPERKWLKDVRDHFRKMTSTMPPLSRYRIEKHLAWFVDPFLDNVEDEVVQNIDESE